MSSHNTYHHTSYGAPEYGYVSTSSSTVTPSSYLRPISGPYYSNNLRPPAETAPRPGSSISSGEHSSEGRHSRRRSGVYIDGEKIVISGSSSSPRRSRDRERDGDRVRDRASRPVPIPIPSMPRSSTMPSSTHAPSYERGRRPIIVEDLVPGATSSRIPIEPVDVVEHSSRQGRSSRHYHRRHHDNSPLGYGSAEEDSHRRKEHRRRAKEDVRIAHGGSVYPSSAPTHGAGHDPAAYGSSFGSSYGSSYGSSAGSGFTPPAGTSPAAEAATKTLRWEDQVRKSQNDKIASRPKLDRSASTNNRKLQGEVKSILKKPGGASGTTTPAPDSTSRPSSSHREWASTAAVDPNGLSASLAGLSLDNGDDRDLRDRLARRFDRPLRRYSTYGSGSRPQSEYWTTATTTNPGGYPPSYRW